MSERSLDNTRKIRLFGVDAESPMKGELVGHNDVYKHCHQMFMTCICYDEWEDAEEGLIKRHGADFMKEFFTEFSKSEFLVYRQKIINGKGADSKLEMHQLIPAAMGFNAYRYNVDGFEGKDIVYKSNRDTLASWLADALTSEKPTTNLRRLYDYMKDVEKFGTIEMSKRLYDARPSEVNQRWKVLEILSIAVVKNGRIPNVAQISKTLKDLKSPFKERRDLEKSLRDLGLSKILCLRDV